MENTKVIERINASENLRHYFKENKIVYYKDKQKNVDVYILPYRITDKKIKIDIDIIASQKSELCRMGFKSRLRSRSNLNNILLDINSRLINGSLSSESNSDHIMFTVSFSLNNDSNLESIFKRNLVRCLAVFLELYDKNIIEADTYNE